LADRHVDVQIGAQGSSFHLSRWQVRSVVRQSEIAVGIYPVSDKCPKCGGAASVRIKPETPHFTGQSDRACTACGARYTPPIPIWAALVLIGLGITIVLGSLYLAFVALAGPYDTQDMQTKAVRYIGTVVMVLFGLGLAGSGIWRLLSGKMRGGVDGERKQGPHDASTG
jgi:hypothetical protein